MVVNEFATAKMVCMVENMAQAEFPVHGFFEKC